MSCIYLSGRAPGGVAVALETQALRSPVAASSCAALCRLALGLGGDAALRLLVSDAFVSLLRGYGSPEQRLKLARSYLAQLRIPASSLLSDASGGALLGPCRFLVFSSERLAPRLFSEEEASGAGVRLGDLVAALCSLSPVPLGALDAAMDAEVVYPWQALASMLSPRPLLGFAPADQDSWLEGLPLPSSSLSWLALNDRLLSRRPPDVPFFRIRCALRGFFDPLALLPRAGRRLQAQLGASVLCFLLSCHLLSLAAAPSSAAG
jgi:hypothetical protein